MIIPALTLTACKKKKNETAEPAMAVIEKPQLKIDNGRFAK